MLQGNKLKKKLLLFGIIFTLILSVGNVMVPVNGGQNKVCAQVTKDIGYYMNHADSIPKSKLDKIFIAYVKKTKDIGVVFSMKSYLSKNAIDKIATEYINKTKDYGMYYSLKPYLSKKVSKKLKKVIDKNMNGFNNA